MYDIRIFAKKEKKIESSIQTIRIFRQDIGMGFGVEKYIMLIMKIRGEKKKSNWKNRTGLSGKQQNTKRKKKLEVPWNI